MPNIGGILQHILRPPNNLQFAIAQVAHNLLGTHQRQIYVLPCGFGKSRVAATIALLILSLRSAVKKVYIIYSNEVLKKKDEVDFMDLWKIIPRGALVEYHSDINFVPVANSVLIIDESDEHIYESP